MAAGYQYTGKKTKRVLRNNRVWRSKMAVYICSAVVVVLISLVMLYFFVWTWPVQPQATAEIAAMSMPESTMDEPPKPVETTNPEPTRKPLVIQESFEDIYEQNSDIVAWICIPNTNIDYPIVQTGNNQDYMKRDFYGNDSEAGTLFLDHQCDITNMYQAAHQIVYGHNMKNGTMFHALTNYADEEFFEQNRYISLNTLYGNYTFEVFAAYETPISFFYLETHFADREAWLKFTKVFEDKSIHKSGVALGEDDVVLTLSTCTNRHDKNMRFVVHARLTNPEIYNMVYDYIY